MKIYLINSTENFSKEDFAIDTRIRIFSPDQGYIEATVFEHCENHFNVKTDHDSDGRFFVISLTYDGETIHSGNSVLFTYKQVELHTNQELQFTLDSSFDNNAVNLLNGVAQNLNEEEQTFEVYNKDGAYIYCFDKYSFRDAVVDGRVVRLKNFRLTQIESQSVDEVQAEMNELIKQERTLRSALMKQLSDGAKFTLLINSFADKIEEAECLAAHAVEILSMLDDHEYNNDFAALIDHFNKLEKKIKNIMLTHFNDKLRMSAAERKAYAYMLEIIEAFCSRFTEKIQAANFTM